MNIRTLLLTTIALTILCLWAINPVKAEETQPVTPTPEVSPPQLITPGIFRMTRDVPCTNIQIVQAILAQRGQKPIASGSAIVETELFNVIVIALNDATGEFSIVIANEENQVACNIYSGDNFKVIGQ
jgi:hypothetical protein